MFKIHWLQVRGHMTRKNLKQKKAADHEILAVNAAILLQAHTRGLLARKAYKKIREDAKVESVDTGVRRATSLTLELYFTSLKSQLFHPLRLFVRTGLQFTR